MMIIGHRGARGHSPENTIESFQKAILMNVDGIEFDVHLSADGEIVVIHDETLDRTTSGKGFVKDFTLQQLNALQIDHNHKIPTLSQVFDLSENVLMNVELKVSETAKPVVRLIEKYVAGHNRNYKQFLVSSFNWNALQQVRELNPDIQLGVLTHTDLELAIGFAEHIKAETIHPHYHLLTHENTSLMQQKGFKVFAWTVNELEDISLVKSFSPDGIITDFPERI